MTMIRHHTHPTEQKQVAKPTKNTATKL